MPTALGPIRVLTVADSTVLRTGLRAMLVEDPEVTIVAEASNVAEATNLARDVRPDVAIVDVRDPSRIDLRTCQELHAQGYGCQVIILTARSDEEAILDLIMDGAAGYLFEDVSPDELHEAIHTVHQGGSPVDPHMAAVIAGRLRARSLGDKSPFAPLSVDEFEVLERIVRGETNRQIGNALHLDDKVVKHRVSNILKKINAKNRVAAAAWWARHHQSETIERV